MMGDMIAQEVALRGLIEALTGVSAINGDQWNGEHSVYAETHQDDEEPAIHVFIWNDSAGANDWSLDVFLACAELENYPEWTPETADAMTKVTEYLIAGRTAQNPQYPPERGNRLAGLAMLARGCTKHPAYRAKRPPRTNCRVCVEMWQARAALSPKEAGTLD